MYYHLIQNVQRDGKRGYRLVKTYTYWKPMMNHLLKSEGVAHWVYGSNKDHLFIVDDGHGNRTFGGFQCRYWNSGGWNFGQMPKLPFFNQ